MGHGESLFSKKYLHVDIQSDNSDDDNVDIAAQRIITSLPFDSDKRIDIGEIIGTAPTLTGGKLDVNVSTPVIKDLIKKYIIRG